MIIPERAQVVIVGGGIIGCSVAYHLTRRGVTDVLLLEQGQLTGGTTWHAAGLVSQLKSNQTLTELATYSARLFEMLEDETGQATGYRTPGSISVAADHERWEEIMRGVSMANAMGIEAHPIGLDELTEKWPLIRTDDLVGAAFIPRDAVTSPVDTTMALAKGARDRGATLVEGVAVTAIRRDGDRVSGVETEAGTVETETVVLCAGMWTRRLAATAGVNVPLQACEHFYVVTEPLEGVYPGMPTVRDPGGYTYFKEETGKIMAGFFEPRGKIWRVDDIPRDFSFGRLPEDWEHVGPVFEKAVHRVPALGETGLQLFFNGPEAFTPDGVYHLGEAPELDRCFVAAGFNSVGIQSAGGVGSVLADWIVDGHPPVDLSGVDIRRTLPFESDPRFLSERISESLGLLYAMHWPFRQYESARGILKSPIHDRTEKAGAVFGSVAGWERPNWYALPGMEPVYRYSYGKQNWLPAMEVECRATRQTVGLFDQTSFAKFEVKGPDAADLLSMLSANHVTGDQGRIVYTQWPNPRGGIEADLTVSRLGEERFMVVTGAVNRTRDLAWLTRHARERRVTIADVTEDLAMLGVMGPSSRSLLSEVAAADLSDTGFPFGTIRRVEIAGVETWAARMSYVGEMGWEIYAPSAEAGRVYDVIVGAGEAHGLVHAGMHAMNSLRLEAGYRHWGHDITDQDTPLEAGLGFAIAWEKEGGFIGRETLTEKRGATPTRRLVQFRLEDPDRLVYHEEPVWRDGSVVGRISSGMWSAMAGRCLGMGYVTNPEGVSADWIASGDWEIEIAGDRIPSVASLRPYHTARR